MTTTFPTWTLAAAAWLAQPALGSANVNDALTTLRAAAPPTTVVWFETGALEPILREGFAHPLWKLVLSEPLLVSGMERSGFDLMDRVDAVQALIGRSPFELAHQLASGGVAAGFSNLAPGSEAPFLLLQGNDMGEMEEAIDTVETLLRGFQLAATPSALERRALGGSVQRSWRIRERGKEQDGLCAAWTVEGTLIITKEWDDLAAWCNRPKEASPIARAYSAMEAPCTAFAWFDVDRLAEQVPLQDLRAMAADPGVHFLLGPAIAYAGQGDAVSMALTVQREEIGLSLRADGVDPGKGKALFPAERVEPGLVQEGSVANAQLHRDIHFLLEHRTDLFPPRTQPEFAEALGNLALLVGGPDALDDLVASVHPDLQLQAATFEFPADTAPDVALPSLNVLISLDDAELNGGRLTSAFQAAVALTNVEAAMQGDEALRLGLGMAHGVTVTTAKLPPPPAGSSVDLRFNFEPGCAVLDDTFVFGTRHEAVAQFIGAKNETAATPVAQAPWNPAPWITVDSLRVSGPALSDLLLEQRDLLVMRAVLEDGKAEARAGAEADILIKLAQQVDEVLYSSGWCPTGDSERSLRADLAIRLR